MRVLFALLLVSTSCFAADPLDEFSNGGPFKRFDVVAPATPTPYMTGYIPETRECHLLVNTSVSEPTGLERIVSIAHEAGHCQALRAGLQKIDGGATRYGEAFGDAFALAWISANVPDQLDAAAYMLWGRRGLDRQLDPAYNTLLIIRLTRASLPTKLGLVEFVKGVVGDAN